MKTGEPQLTEKQKYPQIKRFQSLNETFFCLLKNYTRFEAKLELKNFRNLFKWIYILYV